jgi:DNA-dependent RNA polymerase auxiliary subunit epsilon
MSLSYFDHEDYDNIDSIISINEFFKQFVDYKNRMRNVINDLNDRIIELETWKNGIEEIDTYDILSGVLKYYAEKVNVIMKDESRNHEYNQKWRTHVKNNSLIYLDHIEDLIKIAKNKLNDGEYNVDFIENIINEWEKEKDKYELFLEENEDFVNQIDEEIQYFAKKYKIKGGVNLDFETLLKILSELAAFK